MGMVVVLLSMLPYMTRGSQPTPGCRRDPGLPATVVMICAPAVPARIHQISAKANAPDNPRTEDMVVSLPSVPHQKVPNSMLPHASHTETKNIFVFFSITCRL